MDSSNRGGKPWSDLDLKYFFMLAQTSIEIIAPIALGMFIDNWFECRPWATAIGAVVGLFGGLAHMVLLVNRHEAAKKAQRDSGDRS